MGSNFCITIIFVCYLLITKTGVIRHWKIFLKPNN